MESLPAVLDVRDDLRRIRDAVDDADDDRRDDLAATVESIRERLAAVPERDRADREGVLQEIEDELLVLEERLDGHPAEHARAARNRVRRYRDAAASTADPLVVTATGFRNVDDEATDLPAGDAVLTVTLVNDGDEPRDGVLTVVFYAPDGTALDEQVGPAVEVAPGDQVTVEAAVAVPTDTSYYTVAVPSEEPVG